MLKFVVITLISLTIVSCSKDLKVENFNSGTWKEDINGRQGKRLKLLKVLKDQKSKLIECSEASIKDLLGNPEDQNLLPRMGRRYYYYVTPSEIDSINKLNPIIIEFEHRGLVKLAIIPNAKLISKTQ